MNNFSHTQHLTIALHNVNMPILRKLMNMKKIRDVLETRQIIIYFWAIIIAITIAMLFPEAIVLENAINPALALMLFATFLQVPIVAFKQSLLQPRFLAVLLMVNFIVIPLLVATLIPFLPIDAMVRFGVLLVLLTPCIDYVITFSHLGRANAHILLVATPILLILQMLLLPIYLGVFLGVNASRLIQPGPFMQAFVWLIYIPFMLAILAQAWAARRLAGKRIITALGLLPVPATAIVLFVVISAVVPRLGSAIDMVLKVVPIYIVYATIAPLVGWFISRLFQLDVFAGRSVVFSVSTRNSLVVLPLALAIPGAIPVLPAIIVTQTLIELISELIYIRLIPKLMNA